MQALLVSDDELIGARIRQVLHGRGIECRANDVVATDLAALHLAQAQPDLIAVVLSPWPEHGLELLDQLRGKPARVLVVGPTGDSKLVLRALRGGAADYVDRAELEAELETSLTRWLAERVSVEEAGRVIAVLAPSGGSGSSTLAANVATVLAKEHKKAALVDLKLQAGDLAGLLDLKPTYTLADLCQNLGRMDRVMLERTLAKHASGVHLLAPPVGLDDIRYVTAEGVRQALALTRSAFPYVVVDLDHSFRDEQATVLREADIALLVIRLDFASVRNAHRSLEHLEALGVGRDRVRLVVNRYGRPKEVPAGKAEETLGIKIAHYVPEDAKAINRANNNGVPVVLEAPWARVSKSLAKLASSVNGLHRGH